MTTIACNTTEMACDLQFTVNTHIRTKGKTKIYMVEPNELHYSEQFLIGFAGGASDFLEIIDFYTHPEVYKKCPNPRGVQGLILTKSGNIYQFDNPSKWIRINSNIAAIGSGMAAAYGALHNGASPLDAVKIASKVDIFTGMGTKVFKFK